MKRLPNTVIVGISALCAGVACAVLSILPALAPMRPPRSMAGMRPARSSPSPTASPLDSPRR
jgi:hypothetical protein